MCIIWCRQITWWYVWAGINTWKLFCSFVWWFNVHTGVTSDDAHKNKNMYVVAPLVKWLLKWKKLVLCVSLNAMDLNHCVQQPLNKLFDLCRRQYWFTSYRQLTHWCWGWLGKSVRIVLPSFAVNKIRQTFPSETCVGFKYPNLKFILIHNHWLLL